MICGVRRSLLYVPGENEKMVAKARTTPADLLVFNLEDGVAASMKETARANVVRALQSGEFGAREVTVRINGLDSAVGRQDLAEVVPCRPDGIVLPKVERGAQITAAEAAVAELEISHRILKWSTKLHAMIESAAGALSCREIALASSRMVSLIFGSADYASDVRCQPGEDRIEISFAMQMMVASARAAGIDVIDAPCFDLQNPDLLRREATQARRLGFDGKSALRPDQLSTINEIFDVTPEEIQWAEAVLAELAEAEKRGRALSMLAGRLIDTPHRSAAERILRRKSAAGRL
jgi:citrate lyase subunit beta / citryl-CoA lyase